MPPIATTLIPKMVARRILEMSLIIYRDPPPPPRTSTIWCSNAGDERRTRDRLSVKYRSFCSGKILDTLQHPDIEPQTWPSATFLIIIPRIGTSSVLKRVDGRAGNVLIRRIAGSEQWVSESDWQNKKKKERKMKTWKEDKYISRHRKDKYNDEILLSVDETELGTFMTEIDRYSILFRFTYFFHKVITDGKSN